MSSHRQRQNLLIAALGQLCAEERVSITAATLLSIAAVMAEHADHATGRHVAVTRASIAFRVGCDVRTITAAWRVLRVSRWAVEAQRGHGSPGTPASAGDPRCITWCRAATPVPCPAQLCMISTYRRQAVLVLLLP